MSYVLNDGPRGVAPATRERVLAAIAELGYRPNAVARSLRTRRTMTFGVVVPDNSNPFFAELARSIEDVGFEHGYTMLLGNAMNDAARELKYVRTLVDRQVDAVMLAPSYGSHEWVDELAQTSIPWLVLDRELEIPNATHVLGDHFRGAYEATAHLLAHGRRRIGCVAGTEGVQPTIDRVRGWRESLRDAGLDPETMPLVHAPFGRAHGYQAGRQVLTGRDVPDALFVASDMQAFGVLRAASELGVRVPEDLALCAFDGIEPSGYTVPALTTVQQPFDALARAAVEWLLAKLADASEPARRVVLPVTLIKRGSCGCPDPAGDHEMPAS